MSNLNKIRLAISSELGIGEAEIQLNSRFSDLCVDSLERASLIIELETELGIEITDDDAGKFYTVQDVLNYADSHCAAN